MQGYENHKSRLTMCRHNPNVLTVASSKASFLLFLSQLQGHRDLKVHSRETVCSRGWSSRCWWIAYRSRPISPGPINSDRGLPAFGCSQHASITWPLTGHCSSPWGVQIHNAGMHSHWRAHVVLISIPGLSGWDCSPTHSFPVCQRPCMKPIGWFCLSFSAGCVGGVYSRSDVVSPQVTHRGTCLLAGLSFLQGTSSASTLIFQPAFPSLPC